MQICNATNGVKKEIGSSRFFHHPNLILSQLSGDRKLFIFAVNRVSYYPVIWGFQPVGMKYYTSFKGSFTMIRILITHPWTPGKQGLIGHVLKSIVYLVYILLFSLGNCGWFGGKI